MFKATIEAGFHEDWSVDLMKEGFELDAIYCQDIKPGLVLDIFKIKNSPGLREFLENFLSK
jgi:hypothetical protein